MPQPSYFGDDIPLDSHIIEVRIHNLKKLRFVKFRHIPSSFSFTLGAFFQFILTRIRI